MSYNNPRSMNLLSFYNKYMKTSETRPGPCKKGQLRSNCSLLAQETNYVWTVLGSANVTQ